MGIETFAISMLTPYIIEALPFLAHGFLKRLAADITNLESQNVPIRVSNGIAYGTFVFRVLNRRWAFFYCKYSIPFLDYFKTEPKWRVSDQKYGYVDIKNTLRLNLDNIPRNQAVMVIVDTESKVKVADFVRVNCIPHQLTTTTNTVNVEIINTRYFQIFGFKPQIPALFGGLNLEIMVAERKANQLIAIPSEFVSILSDTITNEKRISWDVDLGKGEIKRYRVSAI